MDGHFDGLVRHSSEDSSVKLASIVREQFASVLLAEGIADGVEAEKRITRFEQIFRETLADNLEIAGRVQASSNSLDEAIGTTDLQPPVDATTDWLKKVAFPEMTRLQVEVTRRRKTYPENCRTHLKAKFSADLASILGQRTSETDGSQSEVSCKHKDLAPEISQMNSTILSLAAQVASGLSNFEKILDAIVGREKGFPCKNVHPIIQKAKWLKIAEEHRKACQLRLLSKETAAQAADHNVRTTGEPTDYTTPKCTT